MGTPSPTETTRNAELVKDSVSMRSSDLVKKYGITRQRIWQIVTRWKEKQG